jgi:hypothetical protein
MEDLRVTGYNALLTPSFIQEEFPAVSITAWFILNQKKKKPNMTDSHLCILCIVERKVKSYCPSSTSGSRQHFEKGR